MRRLTNRLTEENYIGILMNQYDNIQCNTIEEFQSDLYRVICIKKIIDKYLASGKVNLRLLLNHFIILHNTFGSYSIDLLELKLDEKYYPILKSIFVYLGYIGINEWNHIKRDKNMTILLQSI